MFHHPFHHLMMTQQNKLVVLPLLQALLHVETQPFLKGIAINADRAAAKGLPSRPAEKCVTCVVTVPRSLQLPSAFCCLL